MTTTFAANPPNSPSIQIFSANTYSLPTRTRIPFQYGIAQMKNVFHVFLRIEGLIMGKHVMGVSSEGLAPKWFTKNVGTSYEEDVVEMLAVIKHASGLLIPICKDHGNSLHSIFLQLYTQQHAWAVSNNIPPLLANLGVALVEKALMHAFCLACDRSAWKAVQSNLMALNFSQLDASLDGVKPSDILPSHPLESITVRHTIGLSDPLFTEEIEWHDRLNDGLPQSLEDNIRSYGLHQFKAKLCGKIDKDTQRLTSIARCLKKHAPAQFSLSLDGNEQYKDMTSFKTFYTQFVGHADIRELLENHLMFVEQPLHRDVALDPHVADVLATWADAPTMIIDESDAEMDSFPTAVKLGYRGTSHKNCKGLTKGLLNAARVHALRARSSPSSWIFSGEDLTNIGPYALTQDLAMMALLGISSVERNGHHYFAGLSMFPDHVQAALLDSHPSLFTQNSHGTFVCPRIVDGMMDLRDINNAAFGVTHPPDPIEFAAPI